MSRQKPCKFINASLLTPYRRVEGQELILDGGTLRGIFTRDPSTDREYTLIDAGGCYLSPGFIDLHVHGGGGSDFMDCTPEAIRTISRTHAEHGTTSLLATSLSGDFNETLRFITLFENVLKEEKCTNLAGIHLEGPYFSQNQCGAQDPKYIKAPERPEYLRILQASRRIMRWSAAPELEGIAEFASVLREHNILPSIGHSDAEYEDVVRAFEAGFRHITHFYSCMSTIKRRNGYRIPGIIESAYMLEEATVELIADGRHLPPSMLGMVYREKGADKIALVTDAMRAAGQDCEESILGSLQNGQKVLIEDGVAKLSDRTAFAGSVATTDRLLRTMAEEAGVPLLDAVRMLTSTPARIMGWRHKGVLAAGYDADLVLFDSSFTIQSTFIQGKMVYHR